ncbi:MAG TPA: response regulator [Candidatus Methylacidiphilales bacterium]|nr:response regulator [Candidatus Methylacidiphilales bacterium]
MCSHRKFKALVLDDEPPFERLFTLLMAMLDWECEVVTRREAALACLKSGRFDVIIVDYHMPEGNGLHFILCLRKEGITLPAILMSGDTKVLALIQKDLLNVCAVLHKPFNTEQLNTALAKVMPGSGTVL